uniref:Uncharacterized protein n=1 Tax=Cucumis melo TaxID=3656 RepID=A0A9I9E9S9_CUCME
MSEIIHRKLDLHALRIQQNRQISVEKSVVDQLRAVFRSKLTGSPKWGVTIGQSQGLRLPGGPWYGATTKRITAIEEMATS